MHVLSELCSKEAHPASPISPDFRYSEYNIHSHHGAPDKYSPATEVSLLLFLQKSIIHVPVRHYDTDPAPESLPSPHEEA